MEQHVFGRIVTLRASVMVVVGLLLALVAAASQVGAQTAPPDQRAVSAEEEANGFPVSYTDARGKNAFQCLGDQELCAIEDPNNIQEVVYWSAEANMPVGRPDAQGRRGQASLLMAVEGAFDPDAGNAPTTAGLILIQADGLRPNTVYTVIFPYGKFRVTTNDRGQFPRNAQTLREAGCDLEPGDTCDFSLALRSQVFNNFLRWDPAVAPAAPAGYHGNPDVLHEVVGSLIRDSRGNLQNYFRIEGPNAGNTRPAAQANRFSVIGQRTRDTQTDPAPPELAGLAR